jgi:hypothetical protein
VKRRTAGLLALRGSRRRGISVIEFVMAAALILGVLVASGTTLANVERSLAVSRARDGATLLAANIMTQAAQFKCQLEVDPTAATTSTAWKRCVEALRGEALPSTVATSNPAGDLFFTAEFPTGCTTAREAASNPSLVVTPGCTEYKVLLSSRWLRTAADPAQCQSPGRQPTLLRRTLELRWRPTGAVEDVVYKLTTLQAAPTSTEYDATKLRGVVVRATPGPVNAPAVVTITSGSGRISRVVEACTAGTTPTGEAWFPFLPTDETVTLSTGGSIDWNSVAPISGSDVSGYTVGNCGEVWQPGGSNCVVGS